MLKKLIITIIFLFYFVYPIEASNEFVTDSSVSYIFDESGKATITHNITLENVFPTIYATTYNFDINNTEVENINVLEGGIDIPFTITESGDSKLIKIEFLNDVIGKGQKREFQIRYESKDLAERTGEVWELNIPKLTNPENYRSYSASVTIPNSYGNLAYLSPDASLTEKTDQSTIFKFLKEELTDSGVQAGFGLFQVYSFDLKYHLENPLNQRAVTEIPLPPDTSFQKVYLNIINPKPKGIHLDTDGNWIAKYELSPRQRIDIDASGYVQIYSKERPFIEPSKNDLEKNLKSNIFWEADDPEIRKIASNLKTPKSIYDFVVKTLNYDYSRVTPNVQRLGALASLKDPNSAICMEFTDLFIALARASGIPAREVNGYAYTENPEIQPLSLVADVLHSWPEYWDENRKTWIPIDPTWGDTTGGVDFFDKLDLRHMTFVIHGADPQKPYAPGSYKLGPNPQKDVFVSFSKLPDFSVSSLEIKAETVKKIPLIKNDINIQIYNPGPLAYYDLVPEIYFDGKLQKSESTIKFLPPFTTENINVDIPFSFLGINTPDKVRVVVNNQEVSIPSFKTIAIINSLTLLMILALTSTITAIIIYKRHEITHYLRDKMPSFKK